MGNFYAGAYWDARKESSIECADRLLACLSALAEIDQSLSTWYKKGSSRAAASREAVDSSSREALAELLVAGQNRRDVGGAVIRELGFNAALWNRADEPASFRVTCGSYIDNPAIKNVFLLQLPEFSGHLESLGSRSSAIATVKAFVDAWKPDWVTWASRDWRAVQSVSADCPVYGLATYVAGKSAAGFTFSEVSVEQYGDGSLLAFNGERDDVTSEAVAALQEAFQAHSAES